MERGAPRRAAPVHGHAAQALAPPPHNLYGYTYNTIMMFCVFTFSSFPGKYLIINRPYPLPPGISLCAPGSLHLIYFCWIVFIISPHQSKEWVGQLRARGRNKKNRLPAFVESEIQKIINQLTVSHRSSKSNKNLPSCFEPDQLPSFQLSATPTPPWPLKNENRQGRN